MLEHVADSYADSRGMDKAQLRDFLRGYFLAHPKLELLVTVESLEFPVDGLAQAVVTITTVDFTDPDLQRLKVEFRRAGRHVAGGARRPPGALTCLKYPENPDIPTYCEVVHCLRLNTERKAPTTV